MALMPSVEQLFTTAPGFSSTDNQPAITQSLQYVRGQVEADIADFTTWKAQLLSLGHQDSGEFTEHHSFKMIQANVLMTCHEGKWSSALLS